jgi:hypothetical protein
MMELHYFPELQGSFLDPDLDAKLFISIWLRGSRPSPTISLYGDSLTSFWLLSIIDACAGPYMKFLNFRLVSYLISSTFPLYDSS